MPHLASALTPTELAVLRACVDGSTHAAVAHRLGMAPQNLKNRLTDAYRKLGAQNLTHAVALLDDYAPGWRARLPVPTSPDGGSDYGTWAVPV